MVIGTAFETMCAEEGEEQQRRGYCSSRGLEQKLGEERCFASMVVMGFQGSSKASRLQWSQRVVYGIEGVHEAMRAYTYMHKHAYLKAYMCLYLRNNHQQSFPLTPLEIPY